MRQASVYVHGRQWATGGLADKDQPPNCNVVSVQKFIVPGHHLNLPILELMNPYPDSTTSEFHDF